MENNELQLIIEILLKNNFKLVGDTDVTISVVSDKYNSDNCNELEGVEVLKKLLPDFVFIGFGGYGEDDGPFVLQKTFNLNLNILDNDEQIKAFSEIFKYFKVVDYEVDIETEPDCNVLDVTTFVNCDDAELLLDNGENLKEIMCLQNKACGYYRFWFYLDGSGLVDVYDSGFGCEGCLRF